MKKIKPFLAALAVLVTTVSAPFSSVAADNSYDMKVTVDLGGTG